MDNPKNQIVAKLKEATNVLVTVSNSPSVDQLSAAIGLTLLLNKLDKHATAIFSGEVPSTISFLKPEDTLERSTDSLRDFIIALDKAKADKLRYKVEDTMVKIFITPYRTSISQGDLEFSQGDFNVDTVVALGVQEQDDLDAMIAEHGRILHDAAVLTVNTLEASTLGSINWADPKSSSLSEMLASIAEPLKEGVMDNQMATAFLTGIVAETERFSNEKTTSATMSVSAKLMAAGANQQLVATELTPKVSAPPQPEPSAEPADEPENSEVQDIQSAEPTTVPIAEQPQTLPEPVAEPEPVPQAPPKVEDNSGSLQVEHDEPSTSSVLEDEKLEDQSIEQIHIDEQGTLRPMSEIKKEKKVIQPLPKPPEPEGPIFDGSKFVVQAPIMGGTLTANTQPEKLDPSTDPLSLPQPQQQAGPLLEHDTSQQTLQELEQSVNSPHLQMPDTEEARQAVAQAVNSAPDQPLPPISALNAQPVDLNLRDDQDETPPNSSAPPPVPPPIIPPIS